MTKQQLRQLIREQKRLLTPEILEKAEQYLESRLQATPSFLQAKVILLYASLNDEVPTLCLLEKIAQGGMVDNMQHDTVGKQILLPCVISDTELELRCYTGTDDLEVRGKYRIHEPVGHPFSDYAAIDLLIVPGMAFDKYGHRLGRGKGYYDRLLAHPDLKTIHKIGLCFDFQCVDEVPFEAHDMLMDEVISIPTS